MCIPCGNEVFQEQVYLQLHHCLCVVWCTTMSSVFNYERTPRASETTNEFKMEIDNRFIPCILMSSRGI